ncbi:MAG: hypothetical protein MJY89_00590 [Bacteroidales bacterium]|nr:hypothetical protein [Bacteroidales bacterium]
MEIVDQFSATCANPDFEKDFIFNFVLGDANNLKSDRDRIIVYSSNRRRLRPDNVNENDVIVHLSNENLRYNYCFLSRKNIVLRSYYNPFIFRKQCYAIPLGWQTGFGNKESIVGMHDKYCCSFIGQIKGYRKPMADAFKDFPQSFLRFNAGWAANGLTNEQVQAIYLDSAFALLPFGTIHPDTIRIMEVLEWGCIPVSIEFLGEDYFKYIYGDHPFIIGKDWEDAKIKVQELWNDKETLARKREEVESWYREYKINLKADINDILSGKEPTRCSQWQYQKKGHHNLRMLIRWYLHFYAYWDYLIVKRIILQKLHRLP